MHVAGRANVGLGSLTSTLAHSDQVRLPPNSDRSADIPDRPLRATDVDFGLTAQSLFSPDSDDIERMEVM